MTSDHTDLDDHAKQVWHWPHCVQCTCPVIYNLSRSILERFKLLMRVFRNETFLDRSTSRIDWSVQESSTSSTTDEKYQKFVRSTSSFRRPLKTSNASSLERRLRLRYCAISAMHLVFSDAMNTVWLGESAVVSQPGIFSNLWGYPMRIACSTYVYIKSEASPATVLTRDTKLLVFVRISKWLGLLAVQCQRRNTAKVPGNKPVYWCTGWVNRYTYCTVPETCHWTLNLEDAIECPTGQYPWAKSLKFQLLFTGWFKSMKSCHYWGTSVSTAHRFWNTRNTYPGVRMMHIIFWQRVIQQCPIGWDSLSLHCMSPVCIRLDRQMYGSNWSSSIQFTIQNRTLKILKRIQYLHSKIACGQSSQSFMSTMLI